METLSGRGFQPVRFHFLADGFLDGDDVRRLFEELFVVERRRVDLQRQDAFGRTVQRIDRRWDVELARAKDVVDVLYFLSVVAEVQILFVERIDEQIEIAVVEKLDDVRCIHRLIPCFI